MNVHQIELCDLYEEIALLCYEKRKLWMKVEIREQKIIAYQKELEATKGDLENYREEISRLQGLCRKHKVKFIEK